MMDRYINKSLFNIDVFFYNDFNDLKFNSPTINQYPLIVILWNILLIMVPFFLCFYLIKYWQKNKFFKLRQKLKAGLLWFFWFLFIPNTAYIITDIRHLLGYCPLDSYYQVCLDNAWMIIFFFGYSLIGWVTFVLLLNQMRALISCAINKAASSAFPWLIMPFVSLGVLLGLINRWNSWEFFIYPRLVIKTVLNYFSDATYFKVWLVYTAGFYTLYFFGNWLFGKKISFKVQENEN